MPEPEEATSVESWLDNPATKREIKATVRRLASMGTLEREAALFALGVEILQALDMYGPEEPDDFPDEGADEPWKPKAA